MTFGAREITVLVGVIAVWGVVGAASIASNKGNTVEEAVAAPQKGLQAVEVALPDLLNEFTNNEVRAASMYGRKPVQSTGRVIKVRRTLGQVVVEIGAFRFGPKVDCYVEKNREAKVLNLSAGDVVNFAGFDPHKQFTGDVAMNNCDFAK